VSVKFVPHHASSDDAFYKKLFEARKLSQQQTQELSKCQTLVISQSETESTWTKLFLFNFQQNIWYMSTHSYEVALVIQSMSYLNSFDVQLEGRGL
jgi:hypothetical protein